MNVLQVQTPKLGVETWSSWREYFAHLQRHGTAVEGPDWDTFSARMFDRVRSAGTLA